MDVEDIGDGPLFHDEWAEWGREVKDAERRIEQARRNAPREMSPGRQEYLGTLSENRFLLILRQDQLWSSWIDGRFQNIAISDMSREHARNAARWLLRNRKAIRKRIAKASPQMMYGFGVISTPAEIVKSLPVYQALKNRVACPPNQKFNRRELKYLRDLLDPAGPSPDPKEAPAGTEAGIRNKCIVYLED
jgi:hypothetical protein